AGAQHAVGVRHVGTQQQRTPANVDLRADGADAALALEARNGVEGYHQTCTHRYGTEKLFGNAKVDVQGVDGFDGHEVGTRPHVIAHRNGAQAHQPVEGCPNGGFFKLGLGQRHGRLLNCKVAGRLVVRLAADEALLGELNGTAVL